MPIYPIHAAFFDTSVALSTAAARTHLRKALRELEVAIIHSLSVLRWRMSTKILETDGERWLDLFYTSLHRSCLLLKHINKCLITGTMTIIITM